MKKNDLTATPHATICEISLDDSAIVEFLSDSAPAFRTAPISAASEKLLQVCLSLAPLRRANPSPESFPAQGVLVLDPSHNVTFIRAQVPNWRSTRPWHMKGWVRCALTLERNTFRLFIVPPLSYPWDASALAPGIASARAGQAGYDFTARLYTLHCLKMPGRRCCSGDVFFSRLRRGLLPFQ